MTDKAPKLGAPRDEFSLESRADRSLTQLVEAASFDDVHFFIVEGIKDQAVDAEPAAEDTQFALLPYEQPEAALNDQTFAAVKDAGYEPANLRDLLTFAIERPELQREYDIVALGTLRTRKVYKDRDGETVWNQNELDRTICQWAVGLSDLKAKRTLVPLEIFLPKVLRKETLLLVKKS